MRNGGRELSSLGKTRTQETRDLLDESLGSNEGIVLASKLLDELLVLVELLQVIGGHGINTTVLGSVKIVGITENADEFVSFILPSLMSRNELFEVSYQMDMLGRGTLGRRMVPLKRLSR